MLRKLLFALLLSPIVFSTGCKKDDPGNEFVINGIHDINMGNAAGNILMVGVSLNSGVQEPVTLSVTGLPEGIKAEIDPASGTPTFSSTITFTRIGTTPAGSYPIHVVGTSATYSRSYDLNLVVPAMSAIVFDGIIYKTYGVDFDLSGDLHTYMARSSDFNGGTLYCDYRTPDSNPLPDGTHTFTLDGTQPLSVTNMTVGFKVGSNYFELKSSTGKTITIKKSGEHISINLPQVTLDGGDNLGMKTIFASVEH